MYKVVFFDVDGTLLSEIDRSMHGSTKEAIQRLIDKSVLSSEIVHDISGFAALHGHGISYFTEDFAMNGIASDSERVMQALSETLNVEKYPEKSRDLSEEVYCLCLYADEIESQKFIEKYPMLTFDRFHGYVINVLENNKVSKLTAIQKVLDHLNICKSEAIAFGDGGNDIEMLQYVGLGIAMGNGGEELKARADFVTKKASEGGISIALKEFRII